MVEYGSCPESNSNSTIPNAYTSDWKVYGFSSCILITSGAIQRIDPTNLISKILKLLLISFIKIVHDQFTTPPFTYLTVVAADESLTISF
jgi:hypothetical protein